MLVHLHRMRFPLPVITGYTPIGFPFEFKGIALLQRRRPIGTFRQPQGQHRRHNDCGSGPNRAVVLAEPASGTLALIYEW